MKTRFKVLFAAMLLAAATSAWSATRYVDVNSANPAPPYTNWATAARVIQEAVDAALPGETFLVTNGVYATGQREAWVLDTNQEPPQLLSVELSRVVVTNSIRLESVNGPLVTMIMGERLTNEVGEVTNGFRCVFLGTNAVLSGFTLTNGTLFLSVGGGVYCEASAVVTNCTLTGNVAYGGGGGGAFSGMLYDCTVIENEGGSWHANGGGVANCILYNCLVTGNAVSGFKGGDGGGAGSSTLYNCTLTGNYAYGIGGGAHGCILNNCTLSSNSVTHGAGGGAADCTFNNCTLTGNSAFYGGGAHGCSLTNCIVYYNTVGESSNFNESSLSHCCTTPDPRALATSRTNHLS